MTATEFIEVPKSWYRMPCWKRYSRRSGRGRQVGIVHRKSKVGLV